MKYMALKKNEPEPSCPLLLTGLEEKTMAEKQRAPSLYNTRLCNGVISFQGFPRHISMQRWFLILYKAISSVNQNAFTLSLNSLVTWLF